MDAWGVDPIVSRAGGFRTAPAPEQMVRSLTSAMIAEVRCQGGGDFLRGAMTVRRRFLAEFTSYLNPFFRDRVSRWSTPP